MIFFSATCRHLSTTRSLRAIGMLTATCVSLVIPLTASAGIFDAFYFAAGDATNVSVLPPNAQKYVIQSMKKWQGEGVVLSTADLDLAVRDRQTELCNGKKTVKGDTLSLGYSECNDMRRSIMELIGLARADMALANDLLAASAIELPYADEPHRPLSIAQEAANMHWLLTDGKSATPQTPVSGTSSSGGSQTNAIVEAMNKLELAVLNDTDPGMAIMRFHHGYFRDQRENDPILKEYGKDVGVQLSALAGLLGVTGDPEDTKTIPVPKPEGNIGVWARKDDLGLYEIVPTLVGHVEYGDKLHGAYPEPRVRADGSIAYNLAYPFTYKGSTLPGPEEESKIFSPVCSREMGKKGYLCRSLPPASTGCTKEADAATKAHPADINLVFCDNETNNNNQQPSPGSQNTQNNGPADDTLPKICADTYPLYQDTGSPLLIDGEQTGDSSVPPPKVLNPYLQKDSPINICDAEHKVQYMDSILGHACYIGQCMVETFTEHTVIPGRNPVTTMELTAPYVGYARVDPNLAALMELPSPPSVALPPYIGHLLVGDFEKEYCGKNAMAHPITGLCQIFDKRTDSTLTSLSQTTEAAGSQGAQLLFEQYLAQQTAVAAGQRTALDQWWPNYDRVAAYWAVVLKTTAGLVQELKKAPLTELACPWTGALPSPAAQ